MKEYVFTYYGSIKFKSQEEGAKHMEKWMAWMGGLGDAVVNRGTPFSKSKTVSTKGVTDGTGSKPITGYTVVKAKTLAQAVAIAKKCPHLAVGGSIVVSETMDMQM